MSSNKSTNTLFSIIAFSLPLFLFYFNSSSSLGFADAAEFALVAKLNSIAHPPGFPAYTISAHIWNHAGELITGNTISSLNLFSSLCGAASILLLYISLRIWLIGSGINNNLSGTSALVSSLSVAVGVTFWHWSHNVEVYALQALAFSLLLFGILTGQQKRNKYGYIFAGLGLGIGLANHHLTMIMFLPFLLWIMWSKPFSNDNKSPGLFRFVTDRDNVSLITAGVVTVMVFYSYMYLRASEDIAYKFGNPDNFSRLFYHLSGGAWIKNTKTEVEGLIGLRFPYFMQLTFEQTALFLPVLFTGLVSMWKKYRLISVSVTGYYLLVLIYQLRIDQTADTDAYMIMPFMFLAFPVAFGSAFLIRSFSLMNYVLPVLIAGNILWNFNKTDAREFNVSESLMTSLDSSSPEGAVILISDWTLVSQYYFHRLAEEFRTDLVVLNYDLKYTNYRILPDVYPEFYDSISTHYNSFVGLLGKEHPQEIYNTGCTLDTPELVESYNNAVKAIMEYCSRNNRAFMADPKAFIYMLQNGLMTTSSHVSGCFVSVIPNGIGNEFVDLPFKWLDSPLVYRQPACTDKIVDLEAMLDFHRNYHRSSGNNELALKAENSFNRIKSIQRRIRKSMPFVYRPK